MTEVWHLCLPRVFNQDGACVPGIPSTYLLERVQRVFADSGPLQGSVASRLRNYLSRELHIETD